MAEAELDLFCAARIHIAGYLQCISSLSLALGVAIRLVRMAGKGDRNILCTVDGANEYFRTRQTEN